ncbi:MAG: uracil-DNA glycosylase [Candidatus Marinimicrobia bacterium]|nr:uracil-DNA glycosylase [Candidatus Neomarinimicrobiota bacterium]
MSDIEKDIRRYFEQRQELFPDDFYEKPQPRPAQPASQHTTQRPRTEADGSWITSGNPDAEIIFLCTRPLKQDLEAGELISGDSGILFDNILKAIDLTRKDVYITPLRPVSKSGVLSDRSRIEILDNLIDGNRPKVLISLGDNAGNEILGRKEKIDEVHGKIFNYRKVPFVYTYHPEIVRRNERLKRPVWEDFKIIRDIISK